MATIKAFPCIRPAGGLEPQIAALPYDVCDRAEAKEIISRQPLSFLRIDKAEALLDNSVDPYDARVYQKAAEVFAAMLADGTFVRDTAPALYLYELTMSGRSQTGLVCCASIDDYESGLIKRHENTRPDKENDRVRHIDALNAQTGPIFLTYRPDARLTAIVRTLKTETPYFSFTSDDGIRHRGWRIGDPDTIGKIVGIFKEIRQIYIADGHHRAASAVRIGLNRRKAAGAYTGDEEFNSFLSVLFPEDELSILDYNRVVRDLNHLTADEFLARIRDNFDVRPESCAYRPECKGTFGMYLEGKWYRLTARESLLTDDPVDGLDVSILQDRILAPLLGIRDPKTDQRIAFIGGIRGLGEIERVCARHPQAVGFSLFPTSADELFAVADAGYLMPPKSTWFEPKLRSGLFIHEIEPAPEIG